MVDSFTKKHRLFYAFCLLIVVIRTHFQIKSDKCINVCYNKDKGKGDNYGF